MGCLFETVNGLVVCTFCLDDKVKRRLNHPSGYWKRGHFFLTSVSCRLHCSLKNPAVILPALLQKNLLVCPPQRPAGERRTVRGLGTIIVYRALFLDMSVSSAEFGTMVLQIYYFIISFMYKCILFYFQTPIFQQEEAAKEMKEKQKKELEKLKHLDLSE